MLYSERLKEIRKNNNMSQLQIATMLGISRARYTEYENERDIMPIKYLNEICEYFHLSLDYLFGFSSDYNPSHSINKKLSGERLRKFRKSQKLTQSDLANILHTSYGTIAGYEQGRYLIATPFLYTICKKFTISADYLLGKTQEIVIHN